MPRGAKCPQKSRAIRAPGRGRRWRLVCKTVPSCRPEDALAPVLALALGALGRLVVRLGLALQFLVAGCAPRLIQLRPERSGMPPPPGLRGEPMEVIASVAGGSDPMPVAGSRVVYGGLTSATSQFVAAAARPWAERNGARRPGGWQMSVEIVRSDAEAQGERLTVELETRVTLRGTVGQIHLGQTRGYCKVSDAVGSDDGAPVVYRCLERMARDLSGWLEGLNP